MACHPFDRYDIEPSSRLWGMNHKNQKKPTDHISQMARVFFLLWEDFFLPKFQQLQIKDIDQNVQLFTIIKEALNENEFIVWNGAIFPVGIMRLCYILSLTLQ